MGKRIPFPSPDGDGPPPAVTHLRDLTSDPNNARRHTPRNVGTIEAALREVGAARSIVIDEDGVILAGNATVEAAAAAGIERVQVIDADGETIIAVRRSGLTAAQKTRLALADNRAADLAEWNPDVLLALQADDPALLAGLWREDEIAALVPDPVLPLPGDGGDGFDATPAAGPTRCAVGDLWQVGAHRLIVGDCTEAGVVERLFGGDRFRVLWTDPPYGVSYGDKNKFLNAISRANHIETPIANDHMTEEATEQLLRDALSLAAVYGTAGAACYVAAPAVPLHRRFIDALDSSGFAYKHQLIWVKNQFVLGRSDYHYRHEPILYGWKTDGPHYFSTERGLDTVFEVAKPHVSDLHPTMKPIELVTPMITNSSHPDEIVYDPFLGSGTTLIAAHRAGRICYGCEISPAYGDVILRRWEAETGIAPVKLYYES